MDKKSTSKKKYYKKNNIKKLKHTKKIKLNKKIHSGAGLGVDFLQKTSSSLTNREPSAMTSRAKSVIAKAASSAASSAHSIQNFLTSLASMDKKDFIKATIEYFISSTAQYIDILVNIINFYFVFDSAIQSLYDEILIEKNGEKNKKGFKQIINDLHTICEILKTSNNEKINAFLVKKSNSPISEYKDDVKEKYKICRIFSDKIYNLHQLFDDKERSVTYPAELIYRFYNEQSNPDTGMKRESFINDYRLIIPESILQKKQGRSEKNSYQIHIGGIKMPLFLLFQPKKDTSQLFIVIRGTATPMNALEDINASAKSISCLRNFAINKWDPKINNIKIHESFGISAIRIYNLIKEHLKNNNQTINKITICGHSMGGAVATLLGLFISNSLEISNSTGIRQDLNTEIEVFNPGTSIVYDDNFIDAIDQIQRINPINNIYGCDPVSRVDVSTMIVLLTTIKQINSQEKVDQDIIKLYESTKEAYEEKEESIEYKTKKLGINRFFIHKKYSHLEETISTISKTKSISEKEKKIGELSTLRNIQEYYSDDGSSQIDDGSSQILNQIKFSPAQIKDHTMTNFPISL